jgi:hypothetical protein
VVAAKKKKASGAQSANAASASALERDIGSGGKAQTSRDIPQLIVSKQKTDELSRHGCRLSQPAAALRTSICLITGTRPSTPGANKMPSAAGISVRPRVGLRMPLWYLASLMHNSHVGHTSTKPSAQVFLPWLRASCPSELTAQLKAESLMVVP